MKKSVIFVLDIIKTTGIIIGSILFVIFYVPYKVSEYLKNLKTSDDVILERKLNELEEKIIEFETPKPIKKRTPRKRKPTETIEIKPNN